MTKHDTPGEVPLIKREKGELIEIIGRLKDNLAWYVEERKRLIEERDALRYTFNPNAEVVDRWQRRAERAESALAQLQEERDRHVADKQRAAQQLVDYYDRLKAAKSALAEALRNLERYGNHEIIGGQRCCAHYDGKPCDCGFLAALKSQPAGQGTGEEKK